MKRIYLALLSLLLAVTAFSEIRGVVKDEEGSPVMGVIIQSAAGETAQTDFDGFFRIEVEEGTMLDFDCLGYKSLSVRASAQFMQILMQHKGTHGRPKNKVPKAERQSRSWELFILANGMTSFPFSPGIGLTVGMVRKGGWYLNAMTGFDFNLSTLKASSYGNVYDTYSYYYDRPFYTGEYTKQLITATFGTVVRFANSPSFWYGGAGYGFKSVTYKTNNGYWIPVTTAQSHNLSPMHSMVLETGIMFNIKYVAVSVGYEVLMGFKHPDYGFSTAHELKIGLGGMFNVKTKAAR